MKAQVLYGINDLRFESCYREPELHTGEVLIRVRACGICGSDVNRVRKSGTYSFPTIPGHEFSGYVERSFDDVGKCFVGKRVTVFPLIPCRRCPSCLQGNYQLCEHYSYLGSRCDGGFAEYIAVPLWNLLEVPVNLGYEEAAMSEPAAVALHALKSAGNCLGKSIAITGTGTISSLLIALCMNAGAGSITVLGRNHKKMEFLERLYPCVSFAKVEAGRKEYQDCTADVVIEGTGSGEMLAVALDICTRHGNVIVMGNPSQDVCLGQNDYWKILRKEIFLRGTWNSSFGIFGKNDWTDVLMLASSGRLKLSDLITHRIELENLLQGIELMEDKACPSNKVMVIYGNR